MHDNGTYWLSKLDRTKLRTPIVGKRIKNFKKRNDVEPYTDLDNTNSAEAIHVDIRDDNYGEYKSDEFVTFCRQHSIRGEVTAPHTPEQNGIT